MDKSRPWVALGKIGWNFNQATLVSCKRRLFRVLRILFALRPNSPLVSDAKSFYKFAMASCPTTLESEPAEGRAPAPVVVAQSGHFVTSGSGMPAGDDGVVAVVISVVFGAFFGLIGGFILAHFSRYLTYLTGHQLGGFRWVIYGMLAGAVASGALTLAGNVE